MSTVDEALATSLFAFKARFLNAITHDLNEPLVRELFVKSPNFVITQEQEREIHDVGKDGIMLYPGIQGWDLDGTIWPFDQFSITIEASITLIYTIERDAEGWLQAISCIYFKRSPDRGGLCLLQRNDSGKWRLAVIDHALTVDRKSNEDIEGYARQIILTAIRVADALTHTNVETRERTMLRQQRRAAERAGILVAKESHTIVIRGGSTLGRAAEDAAQGKHLKPGTPRRRHRVRNFTRIRLGKVETVRAHVRGGKPQQSSYRIHDSLLAKKETT